MVDALGNLTNTSFSTTKSEKTELTIYSRCQNSPQQYNKRGMFIDFDTSTLFGADTANLASKDS
eukprot:8303488-Ditylum_brightwellii.AAC.1